MDVRLFRREGSLVLDHPSIPKVLDHGEIDGCRFVAFELVEGRSLADVILEGPMPEPAAVELGLRLADVLEHAHSLDVVHRDLKPRNVLLGSDDRAWVLDFGIASLGRVGDATAVGSLGSPGFMAPEQAAGSIVGPPADLYSTGVILYLATTGRLPIEAETTLAMLAAVASVPPVPIRKRRPELSPAFGSLVMRLLAKDPADRLPSAAALRRELRDLSRGLGGTGRLAAVARSHAGAGAMLLLTGEARDELAEETLGMARAFGMDVRLTRVRPDDGALEPLGRVLALADVAGSRGRELAAISDGIARLARGGPAAIVLEDAHLADDGTLDALQSIAPELPDLPVLVVLVAPDAPGDLGAMARRLSSRGLLSHLARGAAAPAPAPTPPALPPADLLSQARRAMRLGALGLARRRLEAHLASAPPGDPERSRAALDLARVHHARGERVPAEAILRDVGRADPVVAAGAARLEARLALGTEPLAETARRLDDVLALAAASADPEELAAAANERGLVLRLMDRRDEALGAFESALRTWRGLGDDARAAACLNNLGLVAMETGRLEEAREHLGEALARWRRSGDAAGEATALVNLGNLDAERGDLAAARARYEEAARRRRTLPDAAGLAATLANLGAIVGLSGEHEAALTVQAEALSCAREAASPQLVANSLDHMGAALLRLQRPAEAESLLHDALALRLQIGDRYGEAMSLLQIATLAHSRRRCAEALPTIEAALAIGSSLGRPALEAQALAALGRCRHDAGDARGVEDLRRAAKVADGLGARDVACEARLALARAMGPEDAVHARRLAAEAVELARTGGMRETLAEALRLHDSLQGPEGSLEPAPTTEP